MTAQLNSPTFATTANQAIAQAPHTAAHAPSLHRPFILKDSAQPGSSFYEFRKDLQQAVKLRQAGFIRAIASPDLHLDFGLGLDLRDLEINNPNSLFWKHLERVIHAPAVPRIGSPTDGMGKPQEWACPAISEVEHLGDYAYDPYTDIFMIGTSINVRQTPGMNGKVISSLSNEVVKVDSRGFSQLSEIQQQLLETNEGWRPIITPSGKRGFVSSRYAFSPIGYRAFFEQKNQKWYMTVFVSGD